MAISTLHSARRGGTDSSHHLMATYIYETIDSTKPVKRYEIQQSMRDEPLRAHPETGEAIQRVITGGFGYLAKGSGASSVPAPSGPSCGHGCGCH
jgi:predicted nucleic acid-binding Zn ribbon protein